jgi:2-polyprenyl-6-hydroxyphenyl methylase/3-demethylubiquinone-9 3-methyltransferase
MAGGCVFSGKDYFAASKVHKRLCFVRPLTFEPMQLRWQIAQFFEIHWWQRYLRRQDKVAYLNWKKNYWQQFLAQADCAPRAGEQVLDAGCGPAGIFSILAAQRVDALDPLLDLYAAKLPHFSPADYPNVRFFCQTLESFFPENQYDTIFCLNAINHVADLGKCLDRLVALTCEGGTLAVSIDAHKYKIAKRVLRFLPGDILHPHQFDLEEYRAMFTTRGCALRREVLLKKGGLFDYWLLVFKVEK